MKSPRFIPVAEPALVGNEKEYVLDCLESSWISSNGKYIGLFEKAFAEFCGVDYALTCSNGTVALHLALLALGVGPGDEVLVPTLTYVATANAVTYSGATPVFVDSEPGTWNLDVDRLEACLSPRTRGIIVVHLFGHPVDMEKIWAFCRAHGLFVIEDAAEAHGARYRGRPIGSLGDIGTFSFYGNKILTTGEGGMVVTSDPELAHRIAMLKGQGMDPDQRYWFPIVGYNYRMTNVAAAIGYAQMERAAWHVERRQTIAAWYRERLEARQEVALQTVKPWAKHAYWINAVVLERTWSCFRDEVMAKLYDRGIETRPFFYPLHTMPMYKQEGLSLTVSEDVAARGIMLPSAATLSEDEVDYVCENLLDVLAKSPTRVALSAA